MENFSNAQILDPDNYDPNEYTENQQVRFKDGDKLVNAIITDVDYISGNMAIEFINDRPDEEIKK